MDVLYNDVSQEVKEKEAIQVRTVSSLKTVNVAHVLTDTRAAWRGMINFGILARARSRSQWFDPAFYDCAIFSTYYLATVWAEMCRTNREDPACMLLWGLYFYHRVD